MSYKELPYGMFSIWLLAVVKNGQQLINLLSVLQSFVKMKGSSLNQNKSNKKANENIHVECLEFHLEDQYCGHKVTKLVCVQFRALGF